MSSSSNEYEYNHLQYDDGFANEMQSPWYPTFGQPLLYYSQVQPFQHWQRLREPDKNKPNCFKKAFRWYTQEHVPFKKGHRNSSSNMKKAHLKSFAAWLDEKYNEFLEASQIGETKYILAQTSAVEMDKTEYSEQSERPPKKRYKRDKTSNQNIEIILKPKELSRPASECCQRTKAQSFCNRSNSNVQSNATTLHGITKPRSQSLTSVVKEKEIYVIPFDIPDNDARNEKRGNGKSPNLNDLNNKSPRRPKMHRSRNMSCQCSMYMHERVDAYSQFEDANNNTEEPRHSNLNRAEIISPSEYRNAEKNEKLVDLGTTSSLAQSMITSERTDQKDESTITATFTRIHKNRSVFAPVDENMQTSDHSINLNKYLCPEHLKNPLFMTIVRADKFIKN